LPVSSDDSAGVDAAVEGGVANAGKLAKHEAITPVRKACLMNFDLGMADSLSGSGIGIRLWLAAVPLQHSRF
jgi:hypothetical protein